MKATIDNLPAEVRPALDPRAEAANSAAHERRRRHWDDARLRTKVTIIGLLGLIAGILIGLVEASMGNLVWPMMVMLTLAWLGLMAFGQRWIAQPIEHLVAKLDSLARSHLTVKLRDLPVSRSDEVGRMAKAAHVICVSALKDHHDASILRRTMDSRIEQATARAVRTLKQMAMRDALTDLGNRRFLDDRLEPLAEATEQAGSDLICLMIDMDNFKMVNDTLGHQAGDELLVFLASLIQANSRHSDLAVRLGGDEFAIFMPEAPMVRASTFAEQLRKVFRQQVKAMHPQGPHADLSIGIASMRRDGCPTGEALMQRADEHLYAAKRSGKGCTCGADD